MVSEQESPRIVVVGGGFGGAYCARGLEKKLGQTRVRVRLIDRRNYFSFTPLLIEAGTGALEPRHAVVPLRKFLRRTELHMAEVVGVDLAAQCVTTRRIDGRTKRLEYDHLVLSLGAVTKLPDVPGLSEHGMAVKSLADAVALRDRAIGMLELANDTEEHDLRRSLLTFVVVGAGYTGVEVAGELNEFLTEATRFYHHIRPEDVRIVLVDHSGRILKTLDDELAAYASRRLVARGVEIRLGRRVSRIERDRAVFADGEELDVCTVIWTAGLRPNPLLDELELPLSDRGYVLCEPDLRVRGRDNVWAIGDCAVNVDPDGNPYPATAQHAIREGRQCAANILRVIRGEETRPFVYRSAGMMAPLGKHQGVARVGPFRLSGLPAWFLWRTFYLLRMPGVGRSLRVMLDWTLDWFFRRDYVQLGIHGTHRPTAERGEDERRNEGSSS